MGIRELRARAVNPNTLHASGSYTSPRSFGVYRLSTRGEIGARYRYGNHPVRMNELLREYGTCEIEAIFLDRYDAKQMADLLNSN